ncbi:hypothetical protein [Psychroserpens algicola]|uniref:DUF1579 domain-containing protein n=1 Tax=Psychroserpens algicola TaxID=1719034 RepID=A0ABT0HA47_9FLAO|nr:hypothetical protein [Psychroserpens algicola]MCK8481232.1 hypothetical protein [Psychroserpens algicola]
MKRKLFFILILVVSYTYSQELNENTFDFWVGHWNVSWTNANGEKVSGDNNIKRILDDKVIQENFRDPTTNYTGMSLSIFNPTTKVWKQTWVDSGGGHFNFTGAIIDGHPVFKTEMTQNTQQRMVFKNIKPTGFDWIWEGTKDGGKSWKTLWLITYSKK